MVMAVIAIIFTLILVVGIHEAGHALAARMFQVKIKKISIGFGKPLVQWNSASGCEWVWAMWPLGGYVQLLNSRISPVDPAEYAFCFDKKPIWNRSVILISGALANLITAWLAFVFVFYIGLNYRLPLVQSVQPNSIAAHAGVISGDQFIAVDGYSTSSWQDVGMQLVILWGKKEVNISLKQPDNQEIKELKINLSQIKFTGTERSLLSGLGIKPDLSAPTGLFQAPSLLQAINKASRAMVHLFYFFLMILKQLFTGVIPFTILLGPLGLFAASVASLIQGIVVFFYFIASLSCAVALVNLFPVPGLDGGSILYALIEKIRGKPISVAMEVLLHRLMVIVFTVVLVNLLVNDLSRFLH
ncbi:M50 family metallopeptidase [Legionella quateirensis]|uniref:Membrane associated zinc metalloprotease n=1 Tax=Legionella quateirensis TaxID=45072 RepID=A0A378KWB2_9GAMM|nr:site-2 protease family protein [Legionella quateirensis]KTD46404.1 membrane associated zinc metalloprotease [Legionella quateirensis]STY18823.1 membrane associated zinc metalloprotease [Legionella quateirensis]